MKNRKRNRMLNYDYSKDAIYFITVITGNRIHHFGRINDGVMQLNNFGNIVENQIFWLEKQYPYFELHNFVIMPNHIHLLFRIDHTKTQDESVKIKSVSSLMGALKTTTSKQIHLLENDAFKWHRSFHDHIVRSDLSYDRITHYITNNPRKSDDDKFYL
jgi:putative transposase